MQKRMLTLSSLIQPGFFFLRLCPCQETLLGHYKTPFSISDLYQEPETTLPMCRSGPPASRLAFMLQLLSLFTSLTEILFLHVWVGCRNLPEDYFYFMLILKFFPKSKLDAQSFFSFLLKHLTRAGEAPSFQSISIPGGSSPQTLGLPATASHWPSGPTVPCD